MITELTQDAREQTAHELNLYGNALRAARKFAAAVSAYKRAREIAPGDSVIWSNLGATYWSMGRYEDAKAHLIRALRLDPSNQQALINFGTVLSALRRYEEADAVFGAALKANPDLHVAKLYRGFSRLDRGDWEHGLEDYEARRAARGVEGYQPLPMPYWNGEDLNGKTLFIQTEQGIGDTVLFSRFIPLVKARWPDSTIKLCTSLELTNLLYDFRDIVEFLPATVPWESLGTLDYGVFLGSLPYLLGIRVDTLPPDPLRIRSRVQQQHRLAPFNLPEPAMKDAFRVGICWSGNPHQDRNHDRSIPLELLLPLAENPNVMIYSLQVGPGASALAATGAQGLICDLQEDLTFHGLVGAGNALLGLDLVITVCTSVAHLAGAVGVPVWTMLSHDPYWVWTREGTKTPWYPTMKLFRQPEAGDWASVTDEVGTELTALVNARI